MPQVGISKSYRQGFLYRDLQLLPVLREIVNNHLKVSSEKLESYIRSNKDFFNTLGTPKQTKIKGHRVTGEVPQCLASKEATTNQWIRVNFGKRALASIFKVRNDLLKVSRQLGEDAPPNFDYKKAYNRFVRVFNKWYEKLFYFLDQRSRTPLVGKAPLLFQNPMAVAEPRLKPLLAISDRLVSVFKKKGFYKTLEKLRRGSLACLLEGPESRTESGGRAAAMYRPPGLIEIYVLEPPANEDDLDLYFTHEFGHLVYDQHLSAEAKDYWYSSWNIVQEQRDIRAPNLPTNVRVTLKDRQYFFETFKNAGYNFKAAYRRIKKDLQEKYLAWLYDPSADFPRKEVALSWEKDRLDISWYAEEVERFFQNPDSYISWLKQEKQPHANLKWQQERFLRGMGLAGPNKQRAHPVLNWGGTTRQRSLDKAVDEALDVLQMPTSYSKTNALEDFAETFAYYLLSPDRLSAKAKERMVKTLKIAKLYKGRIPFFGEANSDTIEQTEDNTMSDQHNELARVLLTAGHVDEAIKVLKDAYSSFSTPGLNDMLAPILWHLAVVEGREIDLPKGYKVLASPRKNQLWMEYEQGRGHAKGVIMLRAPRDPKAYQITDRVSSLVNDDLKPIFRKGTLLWDRDLGKIVLLNRSFGNKLLKTVKKVAPDLVPYFTFER